MEIKFEKFVPMFEEFAQDYPGGYAGRTESPDSPYFNKPSFRKQEFGKNPDENSIAWVYDDGADAYVLQLRGNVTGAMLDKWKAENPKPEEPASNPDPEVNEKWKGDAK